LPRFDRREAYSASREEHDMDQIEMLEEQVRSLTEKMLAQNALLEGQQRHISTQRSFERLAGRMKDERDAALKTADAAKAEAKAAKKEAADAQKALRDVQGELEDERALMEATRDKIAKLEALEERVGVAKGLDDLFAS
jgi:hypothetical protein